MQNVLNSVCVPVCMFVRISDTYSNEWCFVIFKGGSMPNTSSSVPYLLSSSMNSLRSRRQSTCSNNSSTGILQQLGSGVVKQLSTLQNPVRISLEYTMMFAILKIILLQNLLYKLSKIIYYRDAWNNKYQQ